MSTNINQITPSSPSPLPSDKPQGTASLERKSAKISLSILGLCYMLLLLLLSLLLLLLLLLLQSPCCGFYVGGTWRGS